MQRRTFNKLLIGGGAAALVGIGGGGAVLFRLRMQRRDKTTVANPPPSARAQLYRDEFRQQKMKIVDGFIVAASETMEDVNAYEERLRRIKSTQ